MLVGPPGCIFYIYKREVHFGNRKIGDFVCKLVSAASSARAMLACLGRATVRSDGKEKTDSRVLVPLLKI